MSIASGLINRPDQTAAEIVDEMMNKAIKCLADSDSLLGPAHVWTQLQKSGKELIAIVCGTLVNVAICGLVSQWQRKQCELWSWIATAVKCSFEIEIDAYISSWRNTYMYGTAICVNESILFQSADIWRIHLHIAILIETPTLTLNRQFRSSLVLWIEWEVRAASGVSPYRMHCNQLVDSVSDKSSLKQLPSQLVCGIGDGWPSNAPQSRYTARARQLHE